MSSSPAEMIRHIVDSAPEFEIPEDADHMAATDEPRRIPIMTLREVLDQRRPPTYVLRPYIEANATTLMSGEPGTLKSFIALDWACRAAAGLPAIGQSCTECPKRVLLIFAEGKGLQQRLDGWLLSQGDAATNNNVEAEELIAKNLLLIERPVNLSSGETLGLLVEQLDGRNFAPDLIVIDTLTRNSDGSVEESNAQAQKFLNQLDRELRCRYGCAVLLVHHLGKDPGKGARGPSSLVANTEAEITVSHVDRQKRIVKVEFGRVKDTEPPAPFALQGKVIETRYIQEDKPVTTLVIAQAELSIQRAMQVDLTGKNQKTLLQALETARSRYGTSSYEKVELHELAKSAGVEKKRVAEAIQGLVQHGFLRASGGDSKYRFMSDATVQERCEG